MRWYYVNVNYIWEDTDKIALSVSHPAKTKEAAIALYNQEIESGAKCADDKSKPAKIDLTEYIYSKKTNKTRTIVIYQNY